MNKKLVFLIVLLFPTLLQSAPLSESAALRATIPLDAVSYLRIPNPWGLFATPKGSVLNDALAHKQHVQQVQNVEASFYQNVLKKAGSLLHPGLPLLFHHLRSPIEAIALLPENAPLPTMSLLISAKLNFTSFETLNDFLQELVAKTPPLMLTEKLATDSYGVLTVGPVPPILLHYNIETQILSLMAGMTVNSSLFKQTLASLTPVTQHPMYDLEKQVDTSYQGFFHWLNLQRVLSGIIPPMIAEDLQKTGLMDIRAIALGWGVSDSKGRFKIMVDAPRTDYSKLMVETPRTSYLELFAGVSNNLTLTAAGKPETVALLSLPLQQWQNSFEKILNQEAPSEVVQQYEGFKAALAQEMGFSLEDLLQAFGPQLIFFSDEVGEFVALKVGKQELKQKVMTAFVEKDKLNCDSREIGGKKYRHLAIPTTLWEDSSTEGEDEVTAFFLDLLDRYNTHLYWVEEEGYLIFAEMPQPLLDRQRHLARVSIQQWLKQEQHQDIQAAAFMLSTTISKVPRRVYYTYLWALNTIADLASVKIDLFALPTANELKLPKRGTYGMQLDWSDSMLSFELTFENNPLEFLLDMDVGTMAVMGIVAGIAIPAYIGYIEMAAEAEIESRMAIE
jgi:hypothetical protein